MFDPASQLGGVTLPVSRHHATCQNPDSTQHAKTRTARKMDHTRTSAPTHPSTIDACSASNRPGSGQDARTRSDYGCTKFRTLCTRCPGIPRRRTDVRSKRPAYGTTGGAQGPQTTPHKQQTPPRTNDSTQTTDTTKNTRQENRYIRQSATHAHLLIHRLKRRNACSHGGAMHVPIDVACMGIVCMHIYA